MALRLNMLARRLVQPAHTACNFIQANCIASKSEPGQIVMPWEDRAAATATRFESAKVDRIAVACDHMGIDRKRQLIEMLQQLGHNVHDHGTHSAERCDFPDQASCVGQAVSSGAADWGLLICGTGAGMSMAANKVAGVRAALVSDTFTAKMTRRHNNANVICIGSWVVGEGLAREILNAWLESTYDGGRHQRRVDKMSLLEQRNCQQDKGSAVRLDVGRLDVVTMGEMLVEIMRPEPGTPLHQTGRFQGPYPSGAPAIFIDTVARLGFSAAIVGGVGDDDFGSNLQTRLKHSGVRGEFVTVVPDQPTATAHVTYSEDGSRKFVFHIDGTAAVSRPSALPAEAPRVFHVMGCSLMATESMRQWIIAAVDEYHAGGSEVSFDPNIREELLAGRPVLEVVGPVLSRCTVLLPGFSELQMLAASCAGASRELAEASCVEQLLQRYDNLKVIVVKHGAEGAAIYVRGQPGHLPVRPVPVQQVDPTGAGDCFDAAFISGMVAGLHWIDCGMLAARAGAACAGAFGPMEGAINRASLGWGDVIDTLPCKDHARADPCEDEVKRFVDKVASKFKVVAFDLDQCAVRQHSRGSLERSAVEDFARTASPDFVLAVRELAKRGVGLAIATHSDLAEHQGMIQKSRKTYILGDDLVHEVLRIAVPEIAHLFFVVAFNPNARGAKCPHDQMKKRHMRSIAAFYNVELSNCALFDDDLGNCTDVEISHGTLHGKFHAFKSDPSKGFQLADLDL